MPIITPVTPWVNGPVTVAMMNSKVNDRITELQVGTARGVLGSWTSTANANDNANTATPLPGLQQTLTVNSPRLLTAVLLVACTGTVAGDRSQVFVKINGQTSILYEQPHVYAGAAGLIRYGGQGFAVPCAAGSVAITCTVQRSSGTGTIAASSGALLQINDVGAS